MRSGALKFGIDDAVHLLKSHHGVKPPYANMTVCPGCEKTFAEKHSAADRRRHVTACQKTLLNAKYQQAVVKHLRTIGCPHAIEERHGWPQMDKHFDMRHELHQKCDIAGCTFRIENTVEPGSFGEALTAVHRERAHGWPGRLNRSTHIDDDTKETIIGYTEVQMHTASKLPQPGQSVRPSSAPSPLDVCPWCLLDTSLCPSNRVAKNHTLMAHV